MTFDFILFYYPSFNFNLHIIIPKVAKQISSYLLDNEEVEAWKIHHLTEDNPIISDRVQIKFSQIFYLPSQCIFPVAQCFPSFNHLHIILENLPAMYYNFIYLKVFFFIN